MSVQPTEPSEAGATGLLGPVNSVMSAIFDSVEAAPVEEPAAPGAPAEPASPAEPAAPAEAPAEPAADGAPATPAEAPATPAPGAAAPAVQPAPPVVTADDRVVVEQISSMSEALETRFTKSFQQEAIEQAEQDYPQYIEALNLHPLELVGKELPTIDGTDGKLVFRSAEEVAQWQDAVKTILRRELEAGIAQRREDSNEVLEVVHASIQMFADNPDLVPGSKSYNKALASEFLRMAEPYALRMNGKLTGYSIPVQGLIDQVRAQVAARSAAAPAAVAPAVAPAVKAAAPAKPQAGIPSKAGGGGDSSEDFAPMWKALGIDNAPI